MAHFKKFAIMKKPDGNVTDNVLKFKSDVGEKAATTKPNNTEQDNLNTNDMCFKRFHKSNATKEKPIPSVKSMERMTLAATRSKCLSTSHLRTCGNISLRAIGSRTSMHCWSAQMQREVEVKDNLCKSLKNMVA